MLIRQGTLRTLSVDRRLACSLAAIAGALNTAAFRELSFFSANMTGNVSLLSIQVAAADWRHGLMLLLIVVTFIAGAVVSTLLINAGRRRGILGVYAYSILAEGILLAMLGCAELWLPALQRASLLLLGLSFLMGLQNAVVTRISDARVRTTHVSGMVTDIGIEFGMLIDLARRGDRGAEYTRVASMLRLHATTVLSFLVGGILGMLVYEAIGNGIFLAAAGLLCGIATFGLRRLVVKAP